MLNISVEVSDCEAAFLGSGISLEWMDVLLIALRLLPGHVSVTQIPPDAGVSH